MSKKSDVKRLYDKHGDKICLAPFFTNFYTINNVVFPGQPGRTEIKPCTVIKHGRAGEGYNWAVNGNIQDARNNDSWRRLRQEMLDGQLDNIDICRTCSMDERLGASSPRQLANEYLFEHLDGEIDIMAELQRIIDNGLVSDKVFTMDYMPSNYCNYACVMCTGGASSQRLTFEIKNGAKSEYVQSPVDEGFYDLMKDVKILAFTGGETILQPEVHRLIDELIEQDIAKNMIITILTNASSFPDKLVEKFEKFKKVLYTVSVDGLGDVIEYQRRGAKWADVSANAIKINECPTTHNIVNYVASAINILSAMDFVDWCHDNNIKFISISPVYQQKLSVAAMPPELAALALSRLKEGRKRYEHYASKEYVNWERNWLDTIDRLIGTVENATFNPEALEQFITHIRREDTASKKPLREAVPEWAPWFP
jgi:sulfatase maturation enzyme AslB (radical SAM superfamily)